MHHIGYLTYLVQVKPVHALFFEAVLKQKTLVLCWHDTCVPTGIPPDMRFVPLYLNARSFLMNRRDLLKGAGAATLGAAVLPFLKTNAFAATTDTAVVLIGSTINSLDIHRPGTNRPSYQVAINCYDRLVSFGIKTLPNGALVYDYDKVIPEMAERWELSSDGKALTFYLRKNATFWDGKPVTANDVKWSFDRALALGGFPKVQMAAGGFKRADQFIVIDEKTFQIKLNQPSKLSLPDLGVPVAVIINATAAKSNATAADPWATEYLHKTPAGSGAFKVARWDAGQQLVYERNDQWACGPVPALKRVIVREVPSQATRRALIERGDAQLSFSIPNKDAVELSKMNKVKVVGTPIDNTLNVVCLNQIFEPFRDANVRKAIAFAIPYEQIFQQAAYGIGQKMWGASSAKPTEPIWPQPFPYDTNIEQAKAMLAKSAHPNGFEVQLSFDLGVADWAEPTALLIQENLGKIGIKVTLNKVPGANWRTIALVEKKLPFLIDNFGGWLNTPDYYFFWAYIKGNLFNASNYDNLEMKQLVDSTLHMEKSNPAYAPNILRMIELAFEDLPRIPLYQPTLESAMSPSVDGYTSWYHRQMDVRPLKIG
jgi:peptide/nickel transport system substrate-binding protein